MDSGCRWSMEGVWLSVLCLSALCSELMDRKLESREWSPALVRGRVKRSVKSVDSLYLDGLEDSIIDTGRGLGRALLRMGIGGGLSDESTFTVGVVGWLGGMGSPQANEMRGNSAIMSKEISDSLEEIEPTEAFEPE